MLQKRPALVLTLALSLSAFGLALAQNRGGDPPIIIGDGSLIIKSPRAGWNDWQVNSNSERDFPDSQLAVASLRIESPGNDTSLDLNGRRAKITITSGSSRIEITTFANGRGLRLRLRGKNFADFHPSSEDPATLVLETPDSISSVEVEREGRTILNLKNLTPKTTVTLLPPE